MVLRVYIFFIIQNCLDIKDLKNIKELKIYTRVKRWRILKDFDFFNNKGRSIEKEIKYHKCSKKRDTNKKQDTNKFEK